MSRRVVAAALAIAAGCARGAVTGSDVPASEAVITTPPREAAMLVRPPPAETTEPADLPPVQALVPLSTEKVGTLIGDVDRETGEPTPSLTESRYGIVGTDLGASFEHDGRAWFLFGDTLSERGGDGIATTEAASGDEAVALDFLTDDHGDYLRVRPDGEAMGGFEVPVAGLSLDGQAYVVVKTDHVDGEDVDVSVLTRFDEAEDAFVRLREISRRDEDGHFVKMSLHLAPPDADGLPDGGPWVLMWGTGRYRESDAWLSIVPADELESGRGTLYWSGPGPRWSADEADAAPVVEHPTMGDVSVTRVADLDLWLMVYDSRDPRGILMRWSATPWGPWSEPQLLFEREDGAGRFIHEPGEHDGLDGPMIGDHDDPMDEPGGAYAPYVVERFTRVDGDVLRVWYTLSTWNPYLVVLLRTELQVVRPANT